MWTLNIITVIIIILLCIKYARYYQAKEHIIIDNPDCLNIINNHVKYIYIIKSSIVCDMNLPYTENFSHWSLIIKLTDDSEYYITSSAINTTDIYDMNYFKKHIKNYYKSKAYDIITPSITTVKDILTFMQKLIIKTVYGYNIFNCQDMIYRTVRYFCKTDVKLLKPNKDIKLVKQIFTELYNKYI